MVRIQVWKYSSPKFDSIATRASEVVSDHRAGIVRWRMSCAQIVAVLGIDVPSSINDHIVPKVVSHFSRTTAHVHDHEWSNSNSVTRSR
jgi:hypothetical protein